MVKLNKKQQVALDLLNSKENVFLTGSAGTGKSFVIKQFLKYTPYSVPILASTGAAAVLVNGRTFHSYFGLGIMSGGLEKTIIKASQNRKVRKRLERETAIIIDEISMIPPDAFVAANEIAKKIRHRDEPFGGLKIIVVGDFLQLPPVIKYKKDINWVFELPIWKELNFNTIELDEPMRAKDEAFINILNHIRYGKVNDQVGAFLDSRIAKVDQDFDGTVLFGRKAKVEDYNLFQLDRLPGELKKFKTDLFQYKPSYKEPEQFFAMSPIPEVLYLKEGALVMIRKNDPDFQYVNGSLGRVEAIYSSSVRIKLLSGSTVYVNKETFSILDADGEVEAELTNFPLTLAWASTIHKAQGASIDRIFVNLGDLWEYGQAYVAISRATSPEGLYIHRWKPECIKASPQVLDYYKSFCTEKENL